MSSKTWQPTAEANSKASMFRLIAGGLWLVAIGLEAYGIFGILLNEGILEDSTSVADDGTVTAEQSFPDWAFWVIIALLVAMSILTVAGSFLWKRAQALDPPSEKNKVTFFLKSQLGAIVPLIAFVPIIVFIFLNRNMSKQQKGWAGGVGIVLALIAVALGVNYDPPSQEEYTADQQAVIQLLGEDKVYWVKGGAASHPCDGVSDLSRSSDIKSGTTADAAADGTNRFTLKLESELGQCGLAIPNNIDEIVDAIEAVRNGEATEQVLPQPDWEGVEGAPSGAALDELNDVLEEARASE